jgi:hypothetical protein
MRMTQTTDDGALCIVTNFDVESISVLWCVVSCILVCFFEMFESFV